MKHRIVKWFSMLSLAFVLGAGVYEGLQPAQAQSGGFPSRPTFQTVQVGSGLTACTGLTNGQLCVGNGGSSGLYTNHINPASGTVITFPAGTSLSGATLGGTHDTYGTIFQSAAATCSLLSPASGGQNNNVASVGCSVTGNTTVTFTSGYTTNAPSCVASINANPGVNGPFVYETGFTTTTVSFEIFNGGAASNGFTYNFRCTGT
jgi:hypothetical protein